MTVRALITLLPEPAKASMRWARHWIRTLPLHGKGRWCPICERSSRRFRTDWDTQAEEAICIHCGARERHRFVWYYFNHWTDLFNRQPKQMLHVAPEACFEPILRKRLGADYISADLMNPRAKVKMDVTNVEYPDEWFDVIYCSHVLEHVPDDRRAMREFHRILKKSGWAIILVPITADSTLEDLSIVNPLDRLKLYGQEDHVRRYGPDFVDRLKEAGFTVKVSSAPDLFDKDKLILMGLTSETGDIYYCTKN